MVATTFAADTPLAVAGFVARDGNRRQLDLVERGAGQHADRVFLRPALAARRIMTDVEFAELRYAGRPAAILRGFRALYLGLPINCIIIGWVNLAMAKILAVTMGWDRLTAVLASLAVTGFYSALSGLWGVVVTDFFQFIFAMSGTTALAWFALQGAGRRRASADCSRSCRHRRSSSCPASAHRPLPGGTLALPLASFFAFIGVQWWASWYPGQEPGGGGYIAQRMMSARDERHSFFATLWFTIAHYCLRPWPWIVVGLASLVLYPGLADKEAGYVMVMRDFLPPAGAACCSARSSPRTCHDFHAAQLGHVLPGQRLLSTLRQAGRYREALRVGVAHRDHRHDARCGGCDVLSGQHPPGVGVRVGVGRGDRARADSALVLVACERMVRNRRDGGACSRVPLPEGVHRRSRFPTRCSIWSRGRRSAG
jgi:hypothetical protein